MGCQLLLRPHHVPARGGWGSSTPGGKALESGRVWTPSGPVLARRCPRKTLKADGLSCLAGVPRTPAPSVPTVQARVQPKNPHVLLITKFSLIKSENLLQVF